MPERRPDGRPERTLEDCLRIRMAQRAMAYGLNDDEWDSEAMLTTLMGSIETMMDNSLNPDRRQGVQYFHIGDGDQHGAEDRS